jgi:hypothetical protein
MRFRKLRIAWSVLCGLMAVLPIVLWVRSYFIRDIAWLPTSRISAEMNSLCGRAVLVFPVDTHMLGDQFKTNHAKVNLGDTSRIENNILRIVVIRQSNLTEIQIPFWCPALICVAFGTAPWLHYQRKYTLRTLLIVTTLVAVVLGLIVWTVRA